jgi:hypothetical protein
MTAMMARPTTAASATDSTSATNSSGPVSLYTWVLSVRDWRVHALADPCLDAPGGVLLTRCGVWHPMACPVGVARRGELCPRCAAAGVELLELLDNTRAEKGLPQ